MQESPNQCRNQPTATQRNLSPHRYCSLKALSFGTNSRNRYVMLHIPGSARICRSVLPWGISSRSLALKSAICSSAKAVQAPRWIFSTEADLFATPYYAHRPGDVGKLLQHFIPQLLCFVDIVVA